MKNPDEVVSPARAAPQAAPRWPAPAKLNLFLHVIGKRADGYHLLQTVFQFIDFADELTFTITRDTGVRRANVVPGVAADSDLSIQAARLLQKECGVHQGVTIELTKRIPVGAGLGGGSSDAATTLLVLNRLWHLNLSIPELALLGLQLGADVPVFVHGHAAWADGVGEVVTPMELEESWYVMVVPPVHVATAAVFGAVELTHLSPAITIRDFRAGQVRNDLEPLVRSRYPDVDVAMHWLGRYGEARLTGSGGCVFLPIASQEQGARIIADAPPRFTGFLARGLNQHPLYTAGLY